MSDLRVRHSMPTKIDVKLLLTAVIKPFPGKYRRSSSVAIARHSRVISQKKILFILSIRCIPCDYFIE
jgi:hypothetical protein